MSRDVILAMVFGAVLGILVVVVAVATPIGFLILFGR